MTGTERQQVAPTSVTIHNTIDLRRLTMNVLYQYIGLPTFGSSFPGYRVMMTRDFRPTNA